MSRNYDTPHIMDDIEEKAGPFGWGNLTFSDLIDKFDISKFPDFQNSAEPYLCYIIMSRPDLNGSNENINVLKNHTMTSAFMNDMYGSKLFRSMSNLSTSNMFLPIITTRAMSYSTSDIQIKTVEKGNTYYGHMIKYGKHSEDHRIGGTMTIDFRNDRYLSIIKMMYLWASYIHIVSRTDAISPTMESQQSGELDYAASLYFIVTRRNAREIVYWEKLVGVFPVSIPFSMFSYSDDMIVQDRVSIEFNYSIKDYPCDPSILMDLNYLSGEDVTSFRKNSKFWNQAKTSGVDAYKRDPFYQKYRDKIVYPNGKNSPFGLGNVFATFPYVHVVRDGSSTTNSTLKYYLDWIQK